MPYSAVYVFGDSLVDAGNALKLAQWYGDLTFSDLPDGAPSADQGYYLGRFADGYTFADLLANKAIGTVTSPVFPYGYDDPWLGIPIAPFASDPGGNNLNFAYGGAQVRQGDEVVLDLDGQTDAFRDAVDGDAPSDALYIFTMGGNDVRNLAKVGSDPAPEAGAYLALDKVAQQLIHEIGQLIDDGARNILITGIPDVGLIPDYDVDSSGSLDAAEQMRADAATLYSQYLDMLIRTEVVPALEAAGATVTYVPLMDYSDGAAMVTGGLNAVLPTLEALHGLAPGTLFNDLLAHRELVFFDDIHPTGQVHALFGSYAQALLTGSAWIETLPLTAAEVDYRAVANLAVAGEVDTLVVSLVAGTTYTIEMLGISSLGTAGSLADPALRLLGPSGGQIAVNADDGAGFDAVLTFTAPSTGNYTIELSATGALTGAYALQAAVVGGAATQAGNAYAVSSAAAVILEGAGGIGVDVVRASVSYALSAGAEIEELRTTNDKGKAAIDLTGNAFDQKIVGNAGANILDGKAGADTLVGGAGKDIFVLGPDAVTSPGGGNIDTIADYAKGDVVDLGQVLNLAAGINAVTAGFLRVTISGLVQVDVDGGGNQWVTLALINSGAAVAIRYLSGGAATTLSVARVTAGPALTGAVAAAGLLALPAAAETAAAAPDAQLIVADAAMAAGFESAAWLDGAAARPALAGETRVWAADDFAVSFGQLAQAVSFGLDRSPPQGPAGPAALPAPGEPATAAALPAVTSPLVMPSADMLLSAVEAPAGELGRILADTLRGGEVGPSLDALLIAAVGEAQPGTEPLAGDAGGPVFPLAQLALVDLLAVHPDISVTI